MNKAVKTALSICLALCLLSNALLIVNADKKQNKNKEIHISTVEEFLTFSEKCRLDSYSNNLTVYLDKDIDLGKRAFAGIPIFYGTFLGNNHVIKGVNIKADGSNQGLFRYLTEKAVVKNLSVEGKVTTDGKCEAIGGIAGYNSGKIEKCSFKGELGGGNYVGAIAGINTMNGIIDGAGAQGNIYGKHFVGGIVGENRGVVRNCLNHAQVNVTEQQNTVDISDIKVESITGTEAANTVTDIGGIAGSSSGVIRKCKNYASVGYIHMGYNVGGIAGSQIGYLTGCENYAKVSGRKEVGGIVGQMEPSSQIDFSEDSMQSIQKQLNSIYYTSHHISNTTDGSNEYVKDKFIVLGDKAKDAIVALEKLTPEDEEGLKDPDRQQAALNVLSGSANSMMQTMGDIYSSSKNSALTTSKGFNNIVNQVDNMASTLCNPSKKLGGNFSDVSDKDTKEDLTGKVEACFNYGTANGDVNAGGIVGSIAWENDFDPEDDWSINGDISMNFESEVRSVVLKCENYAAVYAKKRNAGGIAGHMAFGLVKDCVNTGMVNAPGAEYVGGIAGDSTGYIRSSSAKCELWGKSYVGGIAGSAVTVTDCRSMTYIDGAKEKSGAVLGLKGKALPGRNAEIKSNYYLIARKDFGGIDSISYSGIAQPLSEKDFLALPNLKDIFQKSKIIFVGNYGIGKTLYVPVGQGLSKDEIPPVPKEYGYNGEWENLKKTNLNHIYFDLTFHAVYKPYKTTVQSKVVRTDGKPILMAQSNFSNMENFYIERLSELPKLDKKLEPIEGWKIPQFSDLETQLRYALPNGVDADSVKIFVRNTKGEWSEVKFKLNKSYAVFSVGVSADAFCVAASNEVPRALIYMGVAIAILAVGDAVLIAFIIKKKKIKIKRHKKLK